MADTKVFRLSGNLTLEDVAHALEDYLQTQKHLETEGVSQSETSYFIQARQPENWKKFIGMDKAVQIRLQVYGDSLSVDLGAGRWVFPMPDGRRVIINGNAAHLRGKEKGILPVGGYGLTTIARADWEFIEKTYGPSMKIFESGLIFAADRKADAVDMADERAELRHGLEPVDPEKTQTKPNDGKD